MADGITPNQFYGAELIYRFTGTTGPDSTAVDSEGNVYQPLFRQGRLLILNGDGFPLANVLLDQRGDYLDVTNLAIKPGTNEAYVVASGSGGALFLDSTHMQMQ